MSNRKGIFGNDSNNPRSRYFFFTFPFKTPPLLIRIGEMKIKKKGKVFRLFLSRLYFSFSSALSFALSLSLRSSLPRQKFFSEKKRERLVVFFVRMSLKRERARAIVFFSFFFDFSRFYPTEQRVSIERVSFCFFCGRAKFGRELPSKGSPSPPPSRTGRRGAEKGGELFLPSSCLFFSFFVFSCSAPTRSSGDCFIFSPLFSTNKGGETLDKVCHLDRQ